MSGFVAAALVGLEAETQDEAWDRAQHEENLPWEVAACVPQITAHKAVETIVEATSGSGPHLELTIARRPLFGKFSLVAAPLIAYGALVDASGARAAAALVAGAIGL
jgi:hypothetical protein